MILDKPIQVNSPYLNSHDRLAIVIAAIQAMGTYKYYKRDITHWTIQITGKHNAKEEWTKLFKEHPEFFQVVKAE